MNLIERINADLGLAMKAGDAVKTGVLRLLKSSLKNEQIKIGHDLDDQNVVRVLAREAKQRRDSIEAYESGNRNDLAAVEQAELEIIELYLPQAMGSDELAKLVDQVIADMGASGLAQMGQVIGRVIGITNGRADGSEVSRLVRDKLK